jgi:hypothetical protein
MPILKHHTNREAAYRVDEHLQSRCCRIADGAEAVRLDDVQRWRGLRQGGRGGALARRVHGRADGHGGNGAGERCYLVPRQVVAGCVVFALALRLELNSGKALLAVECTKHFGS